MDLDDLATAQAAVGDVLAAIGPDAWLRPSPCEEWDVADVARHLVVGEAAFTTSLRGELYELPVLQAEVGSIDLAGLASSYAQGAAALRAALAAADPSGAFPTGLGPMPAPAITELRTIEALVHGWDIATGAGVTLEVDDAVAERAHSHSLALMERLPPGRTPFAPPRQVDDSAPAIDRLVALLGRAV